MMGEIAPRGIGMGARFRSYLGKLFFKHLKRLLSFNIDFYLQVNCRKFANGAYAWRRKRRRWFADGRGWVNEWEEQREERRGSFAGGGGDGAGGGGGGGGGKGSHSLRWEHGPTEPLDRLT